MYDTKPTMLYLGKTQEQLMNLRPRDAEKELGPASFRTAARTDIERVLDNL